MIQENETKHRGIYLLPNLFTTAGLFSGFYAIVAAMKGTGYIEYACIAVFIAMLMDSLDGRVARLTGTESEFGAQYDSISDVVCFGLTPALVVYSWSLTELGKLGWLAAFVYTAATSLRLARFNVQLDDNQDKRYFSGLPCTAAAGVIAGMVWVTVEFGVPGKILSQVMALMTVLIGVLQLSSIRYYSFKEVDLKGNVPFVATIVVVLVYILVAFDPPRVLFGVFFLYALSGPILWLKDKYYVQSTLDAGR